MADGDGLTVSLVTTPEFGLLSMNLDGSFSYQADADAFDTATPGEVIEENFVYQLDDGDGGVSQATATIFVNVIDDGETLIGDNGSNVIMGTDGGEDVIHGEGGHDEIHGLDGADMLDGGNGEDVLIGGGGADTQIGGNGDDILFGGAGADTLLGGRGADVLMGEAGADVLIGDNGNDILIGGQGEDTLTGGQGVDTFVLTIGEGADRILDFDDGEDQLDLDELGLNQVEFIQDGDDTVVTLSGSGEMLAILENVDANTMTEANVISMNY